MCLSNWDTHSRMAGLTVRVGNGRCGSLIRSFFPKETASAILGMNELVFLVNGLKTCHWRFALAVLFLFLFREEQASLALCVVFVEPNKTILRFPLPERGTTCLLYLANSVCSWLAWRAHGQHWLHQRWPMLGRHWSQQQAQRWQARRLR